jgi:hypothetical protein
MKFLCLGYLDEKKFDAVPETERTAILKECFALCVPFRATGKVVAEEGLEHSSRARTIRSWGGKLRITDGPYVETKEQLGSYFIVEAANIDEACKVAALHPAALMGEEYGFGIEVRPIQG